MIGLIPSLELFYSWYKQLVLLRPELVAGGQFAIYYCWSLGVGGHHLACRHLACRHLACHHLACRLKYRQACHRACHLAAQHRAGHPASQLMNVCGDLEVEDLAQVVGFGIDQAFLCQRPNVLYIFVIVSEMFRNIGYR